MSWTVSNSIAYGKICLFEPDMHSLKRLPVPELLAPAGSPGKLTSALQYGADAVYMGGPGPNLRAKGSRFTWPELESAFRLVRGQKRRAYLCLNAFPGQRQLDAVRESLERVAALPPDAAPHGLIVADPGVIRLAMRLTPHLPLHLSTQANTANTEALLFWREQGVRRVNLARECDLPALRRLMGRVPGLELEVFVHGAQCMALSGRCLLSAWLNNRSANMGACTHPCRYDYRPLVLEERTRPGRALWELEEREGYSEVLAAEDLCLLPYLRWLWRAGAAAVKIEGRTKSEGHLAQVVDVYRFALDSLARDGRFDPRPCMEELLHTAKRPMTNGMFLPRSERRWTPRPGGMAPLVGKVLFADSDGGRYRVAVREPWDADASVCALEPGLRRPMLSANAYDLEDEQGRRVERAHPGVDVWLRCGYPLRAGWFLRLCAAAENSAAGPVHQVRDNWT